MGGTILRFLPCRRQDLGRSLGVSTAAFCPGWYVSRPSQTRLEKAFFQREIVGAVVCRRGSESPRTSVHPPASESVWRGIRTPPAKSAIAQSHSGPGAAHQRDGLVQLRRAYIKDAPFMVIVTPRQATRPGTNASRPATFAATSRTVRSTNLDTRHIQKDQRIEQPSQDPGAVKCRLLGCQATGCVKVVKP